MSAAILADLMEEALPLLEAAGESPIQAMVSVLGPAGESRADAIVRLRTTVARLTGPVEGPG